MINMININRINHIDMMQGSVLNLKLKGNYFIKLQIPTV